MLNLLQFLKSDWFCMNYVTTTLRKSASLPLNFPRFAPALCNHFKFWLVHRIVTPNYTVLSVSFVIGLSDHSGFGFATLNWKSPLTDLQEFCLLGYGNWPNVWGEFPEGLTYGSSFGWWLCIKGTFSPSNPRRQWKKKRHVTNCLWAEQWLCMCVVRLSTFPVENNRVEWQNSLFLFNMIVSRCWFSMCF